MKKLDYGEEDTLSEAAECIFANEMFSVVISGKRRCLIKPFRTFFNHEKRLSFNDNRWTAILIILFLAPLPSLGAIFLVAAKYGIKYSLIEINKTVVVEFYRK